jgi:hypothetical protein
MRKMIKFLNIFFSQKELDFFIDKPFKICATSSFLGIAIIEWGFFILFCLLLLFVFATVIMIPITVIFDGKIPSYSIPYSVMFWSLFLWLSFFVVSWILLGRNFPKSVHIDSNGANIQ